MTARRRKYKPRGQLHSWRVTYDETEGGPSVVVTAPTEPAARRAARRDPAMASWRIGRTSVLDLGPAVLEDRRIVPRSLKLTEAEAAEQDALAKQREQDWSEFAREALGLAVASAPSSRSPPSKADPGKADPGLCRVSADSTPAGPAEASSCAACPTSGISG